MSEFTQKSIILLLVILVIYAGYATFLDNAQAPILGGIRDSACTVSTVTRKAVGHQLSSTILSAADNRAWAIIQQPANATNTVALSFDEGAAATLISGVTLYTASTTNNITFGRNTDLPYTGAVTGITPTGSSTVEVTECLY